MPMALKKKGKYWYGDTPDDIQEEVVRYSISNVSDQPWHLETMAYS
jgi:hypothetical protein